MTKQDCITIAVDARTVYSLARRGTGKNLVDLIIPGLILALPMGLVLLQPDLGTAMVLAFMVDSFRTTQPSWFSPTMRAMRCGCRP